MKKTVLIILLFVLSIQLARATHQRAGEITFKYVSGLTYEITVITYTKISAPADRPKLEIQWGDGTSSELLRTDSTDYKTIDIRKNVYAYVPEIGATQARHTYSSQGTYRISVEDPNRNFGVMNIPNSVNVPIFFETILTINPLMGGNNSPVLLNPPVDNGCVHQIYIHNPGAYDIDGDSLSYSLIDCRGAQGLVIPGYTIPISTDSISINPVTGDLIWVTPPMQGEFNVAILIEEYRNGVNIGSVTRDMQINIIGCDDQHPPVIHAISDTCVEAGDTLVMDIMATEPDGDVVVLTATGGPFERTPNPAWINPDPAVGVDTVITTFTWETLCKDVQQQPYYTYFRARDDGDPVNLVDLHTIAITVVGPAPEGLAVEAIGNNIHIEWNKSPCAKVMKYDVYRRTGYYGFIPDHCETGVPAYTGYQMIHRTGGADDTTFIDSDNFVPGLDYCYMVVAIYVDGAESYASEEVCAKLKKDLPIMTNAGNDSLDLFNGLARLAWSKPTELDTLQFPGPYYYELQRAEDFDGQNFEFVASFQDLNDTIFVDESVNLNLSPIPYTYKVDLYSDPYGFIGSSQPASTIFLEIYETDESIELSILHSVPWTNSLYTIYRKDPGSSIFEVVGTTEFPFYLDEGLNNHEEYCYYVESTGSYGTEGIFEPLINYSQIVCGVPIDNRAPCPPGLHAYMDCPFFENRLSWDNTAYIDTCDKDIAQYYIYYSPSNDADFSLLDSVIQSFDDSLRYIHEGVTFGCYAVTAIDSVGNQSVMSNVVCTPGCLTIEFPNVFTPNGDQYNDFFTPYPETIGSVEQLEISIFNRWGRLVFESNEIMINWDGRNQQTNKECPNGTYFFICEVYEKTLNGPAQRTIQGSITILR